MVRINLISPRLLSDQHLGAEYNEILMLLGYVRQYPRVKPGSIPPTYRLGAGHVLFFKNKLLYLKKRHAALKKEMRSRGYRPTKTVSLGAFPASLKKDWKPRPADLAVIKKRLASKLRAKPHFYTWYGRPMARMR
ncbi:Pyrimidine dimer DNA glycosylase [uncultured archaeon]|nr:Pyrimidine dimer DNA glycosylase [uncultured archaeon]